LSRSSAPYSTVDWSFFVKGKSMQTTDRAISLHIRIHDSELLDAVRAYVNRTLQTSLQRFAGRVRNVRITLQDVNGPRGGVDKSCRIQAQLFPSRRWVMHEVRDANVFAAITVALQRVKYTVRKAFERRSGWRERRETIRKASVSAAEEEQAQLEGSPGGTTGNTEEEAA